MRRSYRSLAWAFGSRFLVWSVLWSCLLAGLTAYAVEATGHWPKPKPAAAPAPVDPDSWTGRELDRLRERVQELKAREATSARPGAGKPGKAPSRARTDRTDQGIEQARRWAACSGPACYQSLPAGT